MHAIRYAGRVYVDLDDLTAHLAEHVTALQARDILAAEVEVEDVPAAMGVLTTEPESAPVVEPEPTPTAVPAPTPTKAPKPKRR